jgi:hypothetical protein
MIVNRQHQEQFTLHPIVIPCIILFLKGVNMEIIQTGFKLGPAFIVFLVLTSYFIIGIREQRKKQLS